MESTVTLRRDDGGRSASLDHALSAHLFHSALCLADMNLMLARRRFTTTPTAWAMPSTLSATSRMGFYASSIYMLTLTPEFPPYGFENPKHTHRGKMGSTRPDSLGLYDAKAGTPCVVCGLINRLLKCGLINRLLKGQPALEFRPGAPLCALPAYAIHDQYTVCPQ